MTSTPTGGGNASILFPIDDGTAERPGIGLATRC